MKILRSVVGELLGMFIDDSALALSFILIMGVTVAVNVGYLTGLVAAFVPLAGCLGILAESLSRVARNWIGKQR